MSTTDFDVVIAAIIGFVIGALLVAVIHYSHRKKMKPKDDATLKELQALQRKYARYRAQVNEHFAKTADSIDHLTKSYQQVFDQLSLGAQNLMDKNALKAQLEKRQNKAVTLAYLVEQENVVQKQDAQEATVSSVGVVDRQVVSDIKQTKPAHSGKSMTRSVPSAASPSPQKTRVRGDVHQHNAPLTTPANHEQSKSNVHIAAEKAGLKPRANQSVSQIIQDDEHETALEAVRKHIKQETDRGAMK